MQEHRFESAGRELTLPNTRSAATLALIRNFEEANRSRDFSTYNWRMDAALEAKARTIFRFFPDIITRDVIVDAGSGTGALGELAAQTFPHSKVKLLDISHELREHAGQERVFGELVFGDAAEQNFPDNSVKVKYYSTSGHEVESFGGAGRMKTAVENSFRELTPGGRLLVRDFAKPSIKGPVYMKLADIGGTDVPADMNPNDIDYSKLSQMALFKRFHQEFRGGNAFDYEQVNIGGEEYIKLDAEWAHEFYLRKDYTGNWRNEIKEKYTYWDPQQAAAILKNAGYVNVRVEPELNEYIYNNRLKDKVRLFQITDSGRLKQIDIPSTHMVVTGDKPENAAAAAVETREAYPKGIDYKKLLSSVSYDRERDEVRVGETKFKVAGPPLIGSKKLIFRLANSPGQVLKVVRGDTFNDHNAFKSLFQSVARQKVLDELGVQHLRVVESDSAGPPYRYIIQEAAPQSAVSAADLIKQGGLTETDIKQMAEIVNKSEKGKQWQLDTNPFSWYRLPDGDATKMVYASAKVYHYDENWRFARVGLPQWLNPEYVKAGQNFSAVIPKLADLKHLDDVWHNRSPEAVWWKKYLDPSLQPR